MTMMTTDENYFDHDADIGIIGRGNSLEECFVDAATAMFALMANLSNVEPKISITFEFEETDVELAFVTWLNSLIAKAQAENLLLCRFQIRENNHLWYGEAQGEKWRDDIERGIDVKGATLTMLSVKQTDGHWEAKCVVDV
jgi:SHS2 domain-containing protein